ncbi:MAG: DUF542 domain-containing protein [Candidatus Kapabacteria bacterium]|nr:DUF542 domain-containing protein [Candidatus Kapabacteria bacterium]
MFTTASSLTDILRDAPASVSVFHQHGLDYCCGGKTSLQKACSDRGLDVQMILGELVNAKDSDVSGSIHPELWNTAFLIDYIINNHHSFLRNTLPMACEQMQRVVDRHGDRYPDAKAIAELMEELRSTLLEHLDEEEKGVFAAVLTDANAASATHEIENHEKSHSDVGRKLQRLRALTNEFVPPLDACTTHRAGYDSMRRIYEDTMQHVYLENALLFPHIISDINRITNTHH